MGAPRRHRRNAVSHGAFFVRPWPARSAGIHWFSWRQAMSVRMTILANTLIVFALLGD